MGAGCRQTLWTIVGVIAVLWFIGAAIQLCSVISIPGPAGVGATSNALISLIISGGVALICNSLAKGARDEQIQQNIVVAPVAAATVQNVIYVQAPPNVQFGVHAPHSAFQQIEDPFAPQLPAPDTQKVLGVASGLIRSNRYKEARMLLETIGDEPKAREWLTRLDDPKYQ
jgi:hypothetical protein